MGLFDKAKRGLGYNDKSLKDTGIEGTAKVLSQKMTFINRGDEDNPSHLFKSTLLITVPDKAPYEVTYKSEGTFGEGEQYTVYVDREDSEKVFVDAAGDMTRRITAESAAAQQTSAEVAAFMTQRAAMAGGVEGAPAGGPPSLSPEAQQMMAQNAKVALQYVTDPAQRKMLIEQYRAMGVPVDDADTASSGAAG